MKVSIKRIDSGLDPKYNELIHTFIKFLQKNYQLKDDITIQFYLKYSIISMKIKKNIKQMAQRN